jgi:predicted DNA-binding WGR domain protein
MAIKRKCSKCNRAGHNARTCKKKKGAVRKKKMTKKSLGRKKKTTKRKCSKCNRTGHNARTCKKKKTTRKTGKKKTKAKTKRKSTTTGGKGRSLVGRGRGWIVLHYGGTTAKGNVSNKTWAIKVSGTTVTTRHGKSYGQKKETPRKFKTKAAALTFADKKIREKLRKGYYIIGANRKRKRQRRKNSRKR